MANTFFLFILFYFLLKSLFTVQPVVAANSGPQIRVRNLKLFFLFLNQNICCGYSKEPSQWDGSFEHPKHMFKLMNKKINTLLGKLFCLTGPMKLHLLWQWSQVVVVVFYFFFCFFFSLLLCRWSNCCKQTVPFWSFRLVHVIIMVHTTNVCPFFKTHMCCSLVVLGLNPHLAPML